MPSVVLVMYMKRDSWPEVSQLFAPATLYDLGPIHRPFGEADNAHMANLSTNGTIDVTEPVAF